MNVTLRRGRRSEREQVAAFAGGCLIVLVGIIAIRLFLPSPLAPRINVRWSARLDDTARAAIERQFSLVRGELREGRTWSYDLADPSPGNLDALIRHPSIEDTANIDRTRGLVSEDAPRGTTVIAGRQWVAWVSAPAVDWAATFCAASLLVSGVWLLLSRDAPPGAERA